MAVIGVTDYTNTYAAGTYRNSVKKQEVRNSQTETTSFRNTVEEVQGAAEKTNSSAWAGDMVISYPPNFSGFTYDSSISNKSKEEMTMDEYKQWVMNEMLKMPVSGWVRSACSVQGLPGCPKSVGYDVIGASPEECYGYAGPVGGSGSNISDDGESWWEKRHKRMEELMEEQEKEAVKKAQTRRAEVQLEYLKSKVAGAVLTDRGTAIKNI